MVALAEQEALQRGCKRVLLESTSFQAVPFYEKLGYKMFGKVEGIPVGYSICFLEKNL
jgi:hypothetical protein